MGEMFPGTLGILVFVLRSDQGLGFLLIPRGPEEPGEGRCLKLPGRITHQKHHSEALSWWVYCLQLHLVLRFLSCVTENLYSILSDFV